tara:strand:+ start:1108 stop:1287 length:180 start_codon:yes stop_codon:yes gene_type:complete
MWKSIFVELPTNNQLCNIRVLGIYGQLTQARYKTATQTFDTVTTGVKIPVYQVARWKAV